MISVNVYRFPCVCSEVGGEIVPTEECISGPDINDSMIETQDVAIVRGTSEINNNDSHRVRVSGLTFYNEFHRPGSLCNFSDLESGNFNTVVEKSAIIIKKSSRDKYTADLNIQLEREE